MDIAVTFQDDVYVLRISGQLDAISGPDYEQRVGQIIAEGAQRLIVDFEALSYISSAGLRALLNTTKPLMARGGALIYVNLQPAVHEVFEMTGLLSLFTVRDSLSEALTEIST